MPLDTHQLAPWQLLKQQLLQLATAATASAAALRATCCDLVLTKNRLKKKKRQALVAKIETQMAAVWQQLPLPDRLTIFMLGENQTKFLIKLLPHLAIRP